MARQFWTFHMLVNDEIREILVAKDESNMEPLTFADIQTIVAEPDPVAGRAGKVYVTEGYIWRTYPPEEGYPYYTYWFLLAKDQGSAAIANQLAEEKAVLQEAADILMGVE